MRDMVRRAATLLDRAKGGLATASLTLATAATNAGSTCASGRCGQGCGFACGIVGLAAAGGIAVAAGRRRMSERAAPSVSADAPPRTADPTTS